MKVLPFILIMTALFVFSGSASAQKPRQDIDGAYLLQTQWGGTDLFCKYAPDHQSLGCHTTAIAQVLFYHKLVPSGSVTYQCSNGYRISEDFSDYTVDWSKIQTRLTDSTDQESIDATAVYNYSVACIIQKDFGTNQYVDINGSNNHKTQIEKHFNCTFDSYSYPIETSVSNMFKKNESIYALIEKEIESGRPLGLYYDGSEFEGHAIVIDGYIREKRKHYIHANFGWSGSSNGWYLLPDDLPENAEIILLLTIKPMQDIVR